jgi:hypothetical protein
MGLELLVLLVRGPHCQRKTWFGYEDARNTGASITPGATLDTENAPMSDTPIAHASTTAELLPENHLTNMEEINRLRGSD